MVQPRKSDIVAVLLEQHGQLFSHEAGVKLEKGTPGPLYCWLVCALLFSARISASVATRAARALFEQGWTTPQRMAKTTWEQRTKTLNRSGYARYDERTSSMLGDATAMLLDEYGGDLRKLREAAEHDPKQERTRLKRFKGIGDVGVDIFFREAQIVWDELWPFADRLGLEAAQRLKLGRSAKAIAELVDEADFPRLVAALVRVHLHDQFDDVLEGAKQAAQHA